MGHIESERFLNIPFPRRTILKGAGAATGVYLAEATPVGKIAKLLSPRLVRAEFADPTDTQRLQAIEAEYPVEIVTPSQWANGAVISDSPTQNEIATGIAWDGPALDTLKNGMDLLPKDFFNPGYTNNKLAIMLNNVGNRRCEFELEGTGLANSVVGLNEVIVLTPDLLHGKIDRQTPFEIITHEVIHRNTPVNYYDLLPQYNNGDPDTIWKNDNPWYTGIENIIGLPVLTIAPNIRNVLEQKIDNFISDGSEWQNKQFAFYYNAWYGFSARKEFPAVLGQEYSFGQQFFESCYGELFGQNTASDLYKFCRDSIFQGLEYNQFTPSQQTPRA